MGRYFQGRQAKLPPEPDLTWESPAGAVLAGGPSAPGVDGLPYELYHHGLRFSLCLLAQLQYAARGLRGEAFDPVLVLVGVRTYLNLFSPE
eukprot:11738551-Alexandrium_andersonii.AAC.1